MTSATATGATGPVGAAGATGATGPTGPAVALSTATPKADGTAAAGTATTASASDHVHPTDASRAPLASPAFTGAASFAARPSFNGATPYDTGNCGANIGTSGYQKLASGLIIQWGTVAGSSAGNGSQSFPLAFPNALLGLTCTSIFNGSGSAVQIEVVNVFSLAANGFSWTSRFSNNGTTSADGEPFSYIVVGY